MKFKYTLKFEVFCCSAALNIFWDCMHASVGAMAGMWDACQWKLYQGWVAGWCIFDLNERSSLD